MPPDGAVTVAGPMRATPWGTIGYLAVAAFGVAALSGVALAVPYDSGNASLSIATLLLSSPASTFLRNLHYWSSQLCLILTLWHAWDHLRAGTESRLAPGTWIRVIATLPLVVFLMLSGFLLRGDSESRQALRILVEATSQIPVVGTLAATLLFGVADRLNVVYVQHVATATIAVWLFVVEHARRLWPRPASLLAALLVSGALALVVSPGLHDGLDPVTKGPWYFLGLQEILHWTPWPLAAVGAGASLLAALAAIRWLAPRASRHVKVALVVVLAGYGSLCAVGAFMRGENWTWAPWSTPGTGSLRLSYVFRVPDGAPPVLPARLPVVLDRPEGCLVCHGNVSGLGNAHRPDAIGCASCHGGDVFSIDKGRAHRGMLLIPGNLATAGRTCGQPACHASIVPRVERSVMATMSGVVAVDRRVFGENGAPASTPRDEVAGLGQTPADTHLRQLCASCHLGQNKTTLGPNGEDARGGGCNACHLSYSQAAAAALHRYEAARQGPAADAPRVHPAVSIDIGNGQCFGCHSRSGRISTNYEGWHERYAPPATRTNPVAGEPPALRVLADERVFERVIPDIHQQRGMDCIDCHSSIEVMGDGTRHARKSDQVRVTCEDCHVRSGGAIPRVPAAQIDPESRRLVALRNWPAPQPAVFGRTRGGDVMVNVGGNATEPLRLIRKRTGDRRELKPGAPICSEGQGHRRLSCGSCHTAWAPRCPTCHTTFEAAGRAYDWSAGTEVRGAWREEAGPYAAAPPTLGVRTLVGGASRQDVIDTFVPGMILTIERSGSTGAAGVATFRRLYARVEPHTTRREARSCVSCHNDPVAIGYGTGRLRYVAEPRGGRWTFVPASAPTPWDGLPADAWIPFLATREGLTSTRDDVRPFTVEEQRKILQVGACLTCHDGKSAVMRGSVRDFEGLLRRRTKRCMLPVWN